MIKRKIIELIENLEMAIENSAGDLDILDKDEDVLNYRRDVNAEILKLKEEILKWKIKVWVIKKAVGKSLEKNRVE